MSDHSSVKEAQTAGAAKIREAIEAALRSFLRQRKNDQDKNSQESSGQNKGNPNQSNEPSDAEVKLAEDFYQAYRDKGVDRETAKAAAADAALGLGAKDSAMMRQAEAQVVKKAQQAEKYRAAINTAANESNPVNVRLQAAKESNDLAVGLGIIDKTPTEKAETISQFEPKARTQEAQSSVQPEPAQPTTGSSQTEREALRQDYQNGYEQQGARPETARAASHEVIDQAAGASDGPAVAQAHQEIRQHQVLKDMYQGVFEKNGVSPEVASQAADQMARGNGVAQSPEVRKAHNQALANIGKAQQVSTAPAQRPAVEKNGANQSPEARQAARPTPANAPQSAPSTQVEKPTPEAQRDQTSEAKQTQDKPVPKANRPIQAAAAQTSDPLWQQHSPTEQGARTPGIDYESNPGANDKRFAYNALSAEASKEEIKQSIIRNSPEAKNNANPEQEQYADQSIRQAEQALVATRGQQQQSQPATDVQPEATENQAPERTATEQAQPTPGQPQPQPAQAVSESNQPQKPAPSQEAAQQNSASQKPAAQAQPVAPEQKLTSKELYDKFSETKETGVFAKMSKKNARVNDLAVSQKALVAGHDPSDIQAAIAEHSPHAQTLSGSKSYAKRTVGEAQKTLGEDSKETQSDQGQKSEKGQSTSQKVKPNRKEAQKGQSNQEVKSPVKTKSKSRQKAKGRDQGMGY